MSDEYERPNPVKVAIGAIVLIAILSMPVILAGAGPDTNELLLALVACVGWLSFRVIQRFTRSRKGVRDLR